MGRRGISIIETDLEVDFAPPLGYVDPVEEKKKKQGSSHLVSGPPSLAVMNGWMSEGDEYERHLLFHAQSIL